MRTYAGRLGAIAGFLGAVVSGIPSPAHAGPLEQFVQVFWHDAKPDRIALRYTNGSGGLVVSEDGGRSFSLICAEGIGATDIRGSSGLMDGDGSIWLPSFDGIWHDDGTVCTWTREPEFAGIWWPDIVPDPSRADVKFAITSAAEPMQNGILRSEGPGAFVPFGSFDDAQPTRLRIARRGDGLRFYESVVHGSRMADFGGGPVLIANYAIRYSDDSARSWTEHAFPANEGSVRLEGVDPTAPERIVVSVSNTGQTTLFLSSDAGATFAPYLELAAMGGIAFTPEGRVYIGDAGDDAGGARKTRGLWLAESLAEPARLLTDAYPVSCLGYRASDATLFVCERYAFGVANPETGALSQLVSFTEVERLAECPDRDVRAACRRPLLLDYCSLPHFPCAPACDAYDVDISDFYSIAGPDPSIAACLARRYPDRRPDAKDAGAPLSDAGDIPPNARPTDAGSQPPKHVQAGCHIAEPPGGARQSSHHLPLWAAAAIWLLRARRRVRARRCGEEGHSMSL